MTRWKNVSVAMMTLLASFGTWAGSTTRAQSAETAASTSHNKHPDPLALLENKRFAPSTYVKGLTRNEALELLGVAIAKREARVREREVLLKLAGEARTRASEVLLTHREVDELIAVARKLEGRAEKINTHELKRFEGLLMQHLKQPPPKNDWLS